MRIKERLLRSIERLIGHMRAIADGLQGDVVTREHDAQSQALHAIAVAATSARVEGEQEVVALRGIEDAAWMAYWDYESP